MAEITRLDTRDADFWPHLDALLAWETVSDAGVNATVDRVIADIRARGDAALIEYTSRFDGWTPADAAALQIPTARLAQAWQGIEPAQRQALQHAAERIRAYAERQKMDGWTYTEADGTVLGQQVTPLDRVDLASMADYGKMLSDFMRLCRRLINLPMRVILIGQVKSREYEGEILQPQLTGKNSARELARMMDLIGYMYNVETEEGLAPAITFQSAEFVTKDRSNRMPAEIVNPTYESLIEYL